MTDGEALKLFRDKHTDAAGIKLSQETLLDFPLRIILNGKQTLREHGFKKGTIQAIEQHKQKRAPVLLRTLLELDTVQS